MELATCEVMLHRHLVCAGDDFVHVGSLSIVLVFGALRPKQKPPMHMFAMRVCVCGLGPI